MKTFFVILFALAIAVLMGSEFIRATRLAIAYFKGDQDTINHLMSYDECALKAYKYYGVDKDLFAKYWKEVKAMKGISAVPYDALELAEWEWNAVNNK